MAPRSFFSSLHVFLTRARVKEAQGGTRTKLTPHEAAVHNTLPLRVKTLIALARLALYLERLWPWALLLLALAGTFLAATFCGAWLVLGFAARACALGLFVLGFLTLIVLALRQPFPSFHAAVRRIDRDSAAAARLANGKAIPEPLSGLFAVPLQPKADALVPLGAALWQSHLDALRARLSQLAVRAPSVRLVPYDPYALSTLGVFVLALSFFAAGEDAVPRLQQIMRDMPRLALPSAPPLYVWVEPPGYTRLETIMLLDPKRAASDAQGAGNALPAAIAGSSLTVPEDSQLVLSGTAVSSWQIAAGAGLEPVVADTSNKEQGQSGAKGSTGGEGTSVHPLRWRIKDNATLSLSYFFWPMAHFAFRVQKDVPPTIAFVDTPKPSGCCALEFVYRTQHAYGVVSVETRMQLEPAGQAAATSANGNDTSRGERPLFAAKDHSVPLPQDNGVGVRAAKLDVGDDPWAGQTVLFALKASDGAGKSSLSAAIRVRLPERAYYQPLARALMELRKALVAAPITNHAKVLTALEAFMIDPERFSTSAGLFLGLDLVHDEIIHGLDVFSQNAQTQARALFEDAANQLLAMAQTLERGVDSATAQSLENALAALRGALRTHADAHEIARKMEDLREALRSYLRELAQNRAQDGANQQAQNPMRTITPRELEKMLQDLQASAQNGDEKSASAMMDALESLLNALHAGPGKGGKSGQDAGGNPLAQTDSMLRTLNRLYRDEQDLRDDTYGLEERQKQGQNLSEDARKAQEGLADRQRALEKELDDIGNALGKQGLSQNRKLKDAGEAMKGAGDSLEHGNKDGEASGAQGEALRRLREGMDALAAERDEIAKMLQEQGQGQEIGQGGSEEKNGEEAGANGALDAHSPLYEGKGGTSLAKRIYDAIVKRLSNPSMPKEERDYLERLLNP